MYSAACPGARLKDWVKARSNAWPPVAIERVKRSAPPENTARSVVEAPIEATNTASVDWPTTDREIAIVSVSKESKLTLAARVTWRYLLVSTLGTATRSTSTLPGSISEGPKISKSKAT